jgi:hypothetical protein
MMERTKEIQKVQVAFHVWIDHVPVGQNVLDLGIVVELLAILQNSPVVDEETNRDRSEVLGVGGNGKEGLIKSAGPNVLEGHGLTSPSTARPWEFMYPNPWVSFFHPLPVDSGEAMIPILIPGTSYCSRIDSM